MAWLVSYVSMSLVAGLVLALLLVGAGSLILRRSLVRLLPLATVTMVFVAMAHLPLPGPDMACPMPFTEPKLVPFSAFRTGGEPITPIYWMSTVANFLICALLGALLAPHVRRLAVAAGYGALLSTGIELSQLTGVFGLYPCPWRQFDVDDLILNVAGVCVGFLIARAVAARRGRGTVPG